MPPLAVRRAAPGFLRPEIEPTIHVSQMVLVASSSSSSALAEERDAPSDSSANQAVSADNGDSADGDNQKEKPGITAVHEITLDSLDSEQPLKDYT